MIRKISRVCTILKYNQIIMYTFGVTQFNMVHVSVYIQFWNFTLMRTWNNFVPRVFTIRPQSGCINPPSICVLLADNGDLLHLFPPMAPMHNPVTFLTASQHHIVTNHAFFHGPILSMLVHGENHKYIQQHHQISTSSSAAISASE